MKQRSPLLAIFLIVLVDVLGFTIVIPLLSLYAERFGASPLVATTIVSCYAISSLISTPIIGNLSDRYGRKPLLLVSQAGTCAGFLMLAYSSSLWMVFAGRIIDGATAGNLSIAQAYISDHTAPEDRSKAFGVIGVAFGIGFMFGPGLGGVLGTYGMHVPFIVAACLSATSIFFTYTLLKSEKPPQKEHAETAAAPAGRRPSAFDIKTYTEYFRRPALGGLYVQFFLFTFAFSCFTSGFALFSERRFTTDHDVTYVPGTCELVVHGNIDPKTANIAAIVVDGKRLAYGTDWTVEDGPHWYDDEVVVVRGSACKLLATANKPAIKAELPWSVREVGLLFTFSGLLGILLQGGLIGRLVKSYGETRLGIAGFIAAAVAYALLGFAYTVIMLVIVAIISAFGNGVLRPVITSRITQVVGRHEQGVALGISGSLSSLAMAFAPPTGGALIDHNWLIAWALVPATVAVIGLVFALSGRTSASSSSTSKPPADPLSGDRRDSLTND
ncbi:MAG: permease of the major facilitator superfamily [Myxococcales bacterium]|nr:permease of the major facilitator superfamily [Myxococcales bacterium]